MSILLNSLEVNNNMRSISIIIPVYNTEKYLERCIESILKQDFEDYEIILINDGSPDHSQKIIDKYVAKASHKIKAYKKKNGGLGSARNYGLIRASGKYVGFVDSDDYVKPYMLRKLYEAAENEEADLVICDIEYVDECGLTITTSNITFNLDASSDRKLHAHRYGGTEAFNKLYNKKLFINYGIRYPNGWFEDFATTPIIIENANKIAFINEPLICYMQRKDSIMNQALNAEFSEKNYDIFQQCQRIITAKSFFAPGNFSIYLEEIMPIHSFLKFYLFILAIKNKEKRKYNLIKWGQQLRNILPNWDKSTAVRNIYTSTNSLAKRAFFKIVVLSFYHGKTIFLELMLNLGCSKLVHKQIRKMYNGY